MDLKLNSTMDYLNLLYHYYYMEGRNLVEAPFELMNGLKWNFENYQPCFSVIRRASWASLFVHILILLVKNLIVSHGMITVLPYWISLPCFPALLAYYHYYKISAEPVECVFTIWNFGCIWTLLFQCPLNITLRRSLFICGLTLGMLCLELYYPGFQFAVDVFIVLICLRYVLQSILEKAFHVTFLVIACSLYYFWLGRGPHTVEIFFAYVIIALMGLRMYQNEGRTETCFFLSVASGITIALCYHVAVYGIRHPHDVRTVERPLDPGYDHPDFSVLKSPESESHVEENFLGWIRKIDWEHDKEYEPRGGGEVREDIPDYDHRSSESPEKDSAEPDQTREVPKYRFPEFLLLVLNPLNQFADPDGAREFPRYLGESNPQNEYFHSKWKEVVNFMQSTTERVPQQFQAIYDETKEIIERRRPPFIPFEPKTTAITEAPRPEIEVIVLSTDDDGAPDLSAGMQVKYRTNETMKKYKA